MHGFGDGFAAVADVYCPDAAGHGIQPFLAVLVPNTHAFALDNNARVVLFEHLVLEQVVPNVGLICRDDSGQVVVEVIAIHRRLSLLFLKRFHEILSEKRLAPFWRILALILGIRIGPDLSLIKSKIKVFVSRVNGMHFLTF